MKIQIILLCLLCTAFGIGCKKENQQEVKLNKLQGKWEATKLKWYHDKQIGVFQEDTAVNSGGAELKYIDEIVLVKK